MTTTSAIFNGVIEGRTDWSTPHPWLDGLEIKTFDNGPFVGSWAYLDSGFGVRCEIGDVFIYTEGEGLLIEAAFNEEQHEEKGWTPERLRIAA